MNKNRYVKICLNIILLSLIAGGTLFLFYRQAAGIYESDLGSHIEASLTGAGYSLMSSIFRGAYALCPHRGVFALTLSLITVLTVAAGAFLIKELVGFSETESKVGDMLPLSASLMFISALYIPVFFPYFYTKDSFPVTQPWHNSTYLLMRLFAVLVLFFYFKIEERYLEEISLKDICIFTVLLALANYAKPNFILAFAPMMLIFLIWDFFKGRGRKILQQVKFGVCVLISLGILLFQSKVLYPGGGDSGIAFTAEKFREMILTPRLFPWLLTGMAFPVLVLIIGIVRHLMPSYLIKCWIFFVISFFEWLLLVETGPRATHGNFEWGTLLGGYVLYLASCSALLSIQRKNGMDKRLSIVLWGVYGGFVAMGLRYFCLLFHPGRGYLF